MSLEQQRLEGAGAKVHHFSAERPLVMCSQIIVTTSVQLSITDRSHWTVQGSVITGSGEPRGTQIFPLMNLQRGETTDSYPFCWAIKDVGIGCVEFELSLTCGKNMGNACKAVSSVKISGALLISFFILQN